MSGPYTMPSASMPPYTHMHSGSHSHHHGHSQSQSSINSWKTAGSNGGLHSHPEDGDYSEDGSTYGHQHTHSHSRGRTNSQLSTGSSMLSRERPIPAPLDSLGGWTEEKTLGGKGVLTPGFDMTPMPLHTPTQSFHDAHDGANHAHNYSHGHMHAHSHEHTHHHEHSHAHDHHDHHDHGHGHGHHHGHHHGHVHTHTHDSSAERSFFTNSLLPYTARYPILHAIMTEKDSRRIFYFMSLNFSFMAVQAFYGYVTDSLGLLSDSVHMFFDCVALLVGLLAAVMSKWPPSQRFPFGFGKIETLSGFANGILLMLLSVEIAFEAFERLWEGTHTKRLGELFIVSSLGLLVNLVGMMAFGHHHHGHDHGIHGHSHGDHSHDDHGHSHHHHDHAHDNENMHGIYLHVLADTLGSVSVIVSTVLTSIWGWAGWDPLASCLIAGLIFLSSKPLVYSSARRLLLNVPEATEYNLRNSLGGILQQRGVVGYTTPKFWMDDRNGSDGSAKLVGVVHVVAGRGSGLDEVRDRVREYLMQEGIDAVVQVEREGDNSCWCSRARGATMPQTPKLF